MATQIEETIRETENSDPEREIEELRAKLRQAAQVLDKLCTWERSMGGWEAPCWDEAKEFIGFTPD